MKIGGVIKALRLKRGLSQEALALAVDTATSNLSRIERGQRAPSLDLLERLAEALDTRVSTLFALAEASHTEASSETGDQHDMDIRSQCLTLTPDNRRIALEVLRAINRVQAGAAP